MAMPNQTPAEVFPPGDFVREELEERGWTQADLAEILGRTVKTVNELITGKRAVTPDTAKRLAQAFDTSATLWMNLETAYRLHRTADDDPNRVVARKARLFTKAPLKEMIKRRWIESSENIDVLEKQLCDFFEIEDISDEPRWCFAARKSTSYAEVRPAQGAWLFRARQLARMVQAKPYVQQSLEPLLSELKQLLQSAEEVRRVPPIMANYGIRLVILEPLPQTKIDGATFWLDKESPVIALSLRYDRINNFWHTLLHEIGHVSGFDGLTNDVRPLDIDLVGENATVSAKLPESENKANQFAADFLVPRADIDDFIVRTKPLYSKVRIQNFAHRIRVHPGIVVGQLQHRDEIDWSHSTETLVPVREIVTGAALTDGWGHSAPIFWKGKEPKGANT